MGNTTKPTAKENANAFLDGALRGCSTVIDAETNRLTSARENGGLSKKTTDEEIDNYAAKMGYHHQATSIVQGAPDTDALFFIRQQVLAQQHPNGATYTEQYGDMRSYGPGGAVQQRADNTRLTNASILHNHATAATSSSEEDPLDWAIHDSLMEQQRLYNSTAVMMPPDATMKSTATFTPAASNILKDETPQGIAETRDKALLEIMSDGGEEDEQRGIALQGVVDGLTKPWDNEMEKAHGLLERKGKEASERVDGLAKLVVNRLRTKNNK